MHHLFFALRPDAEAAARIAGLTARLRREHGFAGRPVGRDRLHISLHHLVSDVRMPEDAVARATAAASTVSARPFTVALNRVLTWRGGKGPLPLVLCGDDGVIGVHQLMSRIHEVLIEARLAHGAVPTSTPHVTLLRDRIEMQEEGIEPVTWRVRDFVPIDSLAGQSRHHIVGCWPLRG